MRHGRIQMFSTACGLAVSLAAVAAEPPSTGVEVEFNCKTVIADCEVAPAAQAAEKNCTDASQWGDAESAEARCEKAGFLLGEQAFEEPEGFAQGFFNDRADPMAVRPMSSDEVLTRFDADKDGLLSGQERTTTEVFLEARRASHRASLTYRFDFDKSDTLSAAERLEARRQLFLEQTEAMNVLVETFDKDQSGSLCEQECATAQEKDAEAFAQVAFHEGRDHSFAYREGPGLPADRAEAFEEASHTLKSQAKADQFAILQSLFVAEEDSPTTSDQAALNSGEQSGDRATSHGETVAEASTQNEPG
ncbi:MAG: hypothetical protein ACI89L_000718 [Phycisphaerales bacterium]|jgi:hypothetical protein